MNKFLVTFFTYYAKSLLVWFQLTPMRQFLFFHIAFYPFLLRSEERDWNDSPANTYTTSTMLMDHWTIRWSLPCKSLQSYKEITYMSSEWLIYNMESTCNRHVSSVYEGYQCLMLFSAMTNWLYRSSLLTGRKWQISPRSLLAKYFQKSQGPSWQDAFVVSSHHICLFCSPVPSPS